MAYSGTGIFSRLFSWEEDRDAGVKIRADRMDQEDNGFADALTELKGDVLDLRADFLTTTVRAVAVANVALATGLEDGDTLDGVTLAEDDKVLLTSQTASEENGIYTVVSSGAASRSNSFESYNSMCGLLVTVMEGSANADTIWIGTSDQGGTIDSTALAFSQFVGETTFTTIEINDTTGDHQYIFTVNELAADRNIELPLLTGNDVFVFEGHTQTLTNKTLTSPVVGTQITLDQTTEDYTVSWDDPAAARALTIPDPGGNDTFAFLAATQTLTNKTIDSANNTLTLDLSEGTLTGTASEFNTALSDDDFATLTNSVTLTNKTLTAPDINGGTADALTSLGIRSTGTGAFDLAFANTENLTAKRTLTINMSDADHAITLTGDLTRSGAHDLTLTTTGATNVTFPTSGTLLANVVEDTSPQLGGALDGQGNDLDNMGVLFLTEQANAEADVAGKGQWWVQTAVPNLPMFTNDAGTDFQLATLTGTETLTNKTLTSPTINSPDLGADSVDAITEIAAALKSGADGTLITGTAGTDGDLSQWNADGDLVDGPTPPTGTIVGTSDTQTLTNKTLTSPVVGTQITLDQTTADYTLSWNDPSAGRALTIIDPGGNDDFVFADATQTLTNKTINTASNTLTVAAGDISSGTLAHERGGLEADVSAFSGLLKIESGSTSELKSEFAQSTAPGASDDVNSGYVVGSRWIDTTNDKEYVCVDNTASNAVWQETTASGGGGGGAPDDAQYLTLANDGTLTGERVATGGVGIDINDGGANNNATFTNTGVIKVRAVADSNIDESTDLEDADTLDGVTLATGDLVLLAGQTDAAENGIYVVVASGAASRHSAFDTFDVHAGLLVSVSEGTTYADTLWQCTANEGGTLETTDIEFKERTRRPGEFFWHCGTSPPGYALECDGSAVSRTTYAALFAVTGTTFGVGDGSTTFELPDLETANRFIRAADGTTISVGDTQADGAPNITGTFRRSAGAGVTAGAVNTGAFSTGEELASRVVVESGTSNVLDFDASDSDATYGAASEIRPENIGFLPCIVF